MVYIEPCAHCSDTGLVEVLCGDEDCEMVPCPHCPQGRVAGVVMTTLSGVEPQSTSWLWRCWLPLGALSLLIGHPGYGKSTMAALLAAECSTGMLNGDLVAEPSDVLLISYEDHLQARLRPMMEAADADLDRVHHLSCGLDSFDVLDLTEQLPGIEGRARQTGAKLLIVDPLVAGLTSGVDTHRDASVRSAIAPLAMMAQRCNLAVLATMHLSKMATSALLGAGGSVGFAAAARSILVFGLDREDKRGEHGPARVLAHGKSNLGPMQTSLSVSIIGAEFDFNDETISTSRAMVLGDSETRADDLVQIGNRGDSPREIAKTFLRELLTDGRHRATECLRLAEAAGISEKTLRRAFKDLGVITAQEWETGADGERERTHWWDLPPAVLSDEE